MTNLSDTDGRRASFSRGRGADAAAMLSIACFFLLFFGWILFGDKYVVGGDAYAYSYPLRSVAWEMVRAGRLPLWTPSVLSGYPLLSMAQLALGYPLTWGYLFLDAPRAEQFYILAPFLLAPAFTYAYLRELGRSPLAALLAGLSFAYGGAMTGLLGVIGFPNNALMWLPLMLVAVERARRRADASFASCLSLAACAYAMSVLNGYAQGFLYVGLVALAYAVFLSLAVERRGASAAGMDATERSRVWRRLWRRWRPLAAALCGIVAGAGVGAFQILETMRAARRSIRSTLIYPLFVSGSFSPRDALDSLVAPLYTGRFADVGTYVAPLVLLLSLAGILFAFKRATPDAAQSDARDVRVFFWAAVALVSCVFILGKHTPVYGWLYHVPVVNSFRVPSRFSYVWTFAASVLAAYGWDALAPLFRREHPTTPTTSARTTKATTGERSTTETGANLTTETGARLTTATRARLTATGARESSSRRNFALVAALSVLSALVALLWWRQISASAVTDVDAATGVPRAWIEGFWYAGLSVPKYLAWKAAFTVLTVLLIWRGWKLDAARARGLVLAFAVLLVCFVEPFFVVAQWWPPFAKSAARLNTPSPVTRLVQARQGDEPARSRVYTRVNLFAEEFKESPRFDPQNVTALYGLENVGGYEPLLLERYSRALGNVNLDAASPLPGSAPNRALFDARSHVLDLLGARFVVNVNMSQPSAPPVETDLDARRWSVVSDAGNVRVLENRRALPRAWLVGAAESVDGEEALRRIGGTGEREFDPRRTALLEVAPAEMPALAGGELAPESTSARITVYEPNRIVFETRAAEPSALVVAEIFYPGWEATIDDAPARIHLTNFIMRGVALPAGAHRVEMRYRAPAARNGAIISALTLLLLTGLTLRARTRRGEDAT